MSKRTLTMTLVSYGYCCCCCCQRLTTSFSRDVVPTNQPTNKQSKCGERRCSDRGQHQDTTKGDCDNSKNHKLLSFRVVVASEAMLRFGLEGRTANEARRTRSTVLLLLLLFKSTFHDIQHSIRFKFSYG